MKYYSETLEKFFDDEKSLVEAEAARKAEETKNAETKKILATRIKTAETKLDEACKHLDDVTLQCDELIKECNDKVSKMLEEAQKTVTSARKARYEAIENFNKKFGTYTTSYTGEQAQKELDRIVERVHTIPRWFWL